MAGVLKALKLTDKTCLIGIGDYDKNVYLSTRNMADVAIMPVADFNAWDVLKARKILLTRTGSQVGK